MIRKKKYSRRKLAFVPPSGYKNVKGPYGSTFRQKSLAKPKANRGYSMSAASLDKAGGVVRNSIKAAKKAASAVEVHIPNIGVEFGRTVNLTDMSAVSHSSVVHKQVGIQKVKHHKTKVLMGRASSKWIKRQEKDNGVTKEVLQDSNLSTTAMAYTALRWDFGFNQKRVNHITPLTTTVFDYGVIYNPYVTGDLQNEDGSQKLYGAAVSEHTSITFCNSGTYFPIKMKVSFYRPKTDEQIEPDVMFDTYTPDLSLGQIPGFVPITEQLTSVTSLGGRDHVLVSPKSKPEDSTSFKGRYTKISSHTKTIIPGDMWTLDSEVQLGSGVDLKRISQVYTTVQSQSMASVFMLIESVGAPCEIVEKTDTDPERDLGTAPGWVTCEARKYLKYVNAPVALSVSGSGGIIEPAPLVRAFNEYPTGSVNKIKQVNVANIGDPTSADPAITHYIPVMSDTQIGFAESIHNKSR